MDNKKKILLGEKDILSKDNEDLFLNVNLNSTFSEIRNDKFENVFDVERQFKKERNSSRDFRIYGIVDSTVVDTDNLTIEVYTTSGSTGLVNQITATTSTGLVYSEKNVYGKKRGKFIVDLNSYGYDYVYLKIPSNNLNYKDQIYVQQLVFRDAEGVFVEYGTKTIDINDNGEAIEINNDFYFLYNKHWIKKDLLIVEEKPAKIFLNYSADTSSTSEFITQADIVPIEVKLDKPSPFGLEHADLANINSTLYNNEITIVDSLNTVLTLPYTINFSPGEQSKTYYFYSPLDSVQEFVENITVGLENFVNVRTGETLQHTIFVADKTVRNKVKLNFQDVYQNRNYFTARSGSITPTSRESRPMPSVLRNGLFFEGTPMEFYPSDNYKIKIKNIGIDTILPINQRLGINSEQIFYSNQELSFNITQEYNNTEKNSIKFTFKKLNPDSSDPYYYSYDSGFKLNGVPFVKYGYNFKINYNNFLALFKQVNPPGLSSKIDGWSFSSLESPFDIVEDVTNLTITLVAKSPGTRLDLSSYGIFPDLYEILTDDYDAYGIKAEIVQEFIYDSQKPLEIELGANTGNNLYAKYAFTISKTGYDTMSFTSSTLPADINPITYYMVSGLNTILRNWDDSSNSPVYLHENVTSNWCANTFSTNPTYGFYKTGDVYINGMVLLANQYLSNTLYYSSNPQLMPALNQSHAINSASDFSHDFLPAPINVIPETKEKLSPYDVAQVGYLGIAQVNNTTGQFTPRSFEFRTGTTVPYNLYEFNVFLTHGEWQWNLYNNTNSSNGIPGTNYNLGAKLKTYFQDGDSTKGITSQGLVGTSPVTNAEYNKLYSIYYPKGYGFINMDFIKLRAGTPGNPFEFKNFQEAKYIGGTNNGQDYSHKSMIFIEETPNQLAGITVNKANNFMGGFSVTHP